MSIDHGKLLALAERVAGLAHMTLGKESREEREAIERELRALAQPAEAVEVDGDRHWSLSPAVDAKEIEWLRDHKPDAAQGAVAPFAWYLVGEDGKPAFAPYFKESDADAMIAEYANQRRPEDRETFTKHELFTHPQDAPAQGDGMVLVPVNATEEMRSAFAIAMGDTRILGAKEQFRIAYAKLLATAPSQEGES